MKIKIEIVPALPEEEVVIRCAEVNETVQRLQQFALGQGGSDASKLVFYKDGEEFYFPVVDVLFFETEGDVVFAHTEREAFRTKLRLYELEEALPRCFLRVAKSTIVNTGKIYSIKRDLTAASLVQFAGTHKQVYASRRYHAALKQRMQEKA